MDLCWQVMSLLFNMLSRLVIAFLPRSKRLLISWLQSPSAVILAPKKVKSTIVSIVSLFVCHEVMGLDVIILVFRMLGFKSTFSLSSFTFIKRLSSSLSVMRVVSSASVQFSTGAQLCPTLCDPMNRSTPGLPVRHHLPEFTQTHIHRVNDDIQPSHPLSSPSPPAPNPSQHQNVFTTSQHFA